jgi:hypothetical protein
MDERAVDFVLWNREDARTSCVTPLVGSGWKLVEFARPYLREVTDGT